ncbi:hypothetical protein CI102_5373 [Trichoderma harzianum]|nr:hypothetical protein CI102_5373 [Trichoderma harzianum]
MSVAVRYSACLSTLTDVAVAGEKENQRSVCCHWVNCLFEQGNPGARKGLNALSEKARIFQTLPRERQPKKMSNKIKNNTKIIPEKKEAHRLRQAHNHQAQTSPQRIKYIIYSCSSTVTYSRTWRGGKPLVLFLFHCGPIRGILFLSGGVRPAKKDEKAKGKFPGFNAECLFFLISLWLGNITVYLGWRTKRIIIIIV